MLGSEILRKGLLKDCQKPLKICLALSPMLARVGIFG